MKKVLVATILGLTAAVSTYGQAVIRFDTYNANPYAQVQWTSDSAKAPTGRAGTLANENEFVANLLWSYGAGITGSAGLAVPTTADVGGYGSGFIMGPEISTAASFSSAMLINFTIQVWDPAYASYAAAVAANGATGFINWDENIPQDFIDGTVGFVPTVSGGFNHLPGNIIVAQVPEPSTMALAGLGAAALLIFRRRK